MQRHFERHLGHLFADRALLLQALTHRSHARVNNERLEFLGDAALDLAVSRLLFRHWPDASEGELSRQRAHLVCEPMLHRLALQLELPTLVRLSEGEARTGGAQRPSILADAFEALLGALLHEASFEAVQAAVDRLFTPLLSAGGSTIARKDAKTALQEWLQGQRRPLPQYRIHAVHGRDHEQQFEVDATIELAPGSEPLQARGHGRSRRIAEQDAARQLLERLGQAGE
ncbi:ribonuclease III [Comamonadaceae bacterium SL12-8]|uniref:Ribonuclease III n=1 Tax=Amphibiibacter pelophylacis TaxID=1799477 RepID=A0ACC6P5V4_9BURK